ncbi:MAG: 1,4-dihydroxy-2-naphthoate octaprenyltransferase [Salinivirgaceae bacterium]|nr:1,4-dihydroxy-2-naphthoate octaprenyltransferase [Salinivirgaceae bacterium]
MKFKSWIEAARLRTLPLSVSGIIVGCGMAFADNSFNWLLFALLMATTILLQVLGNFANDLGDFQHGTDNENRIGPKRTLQGGGLTVGEMKRGIVLMIVLSLAVGMTMLSVSFGISTGFWIFVIIGLAAIVAAIRYTMGRNPFGYRGLGDLMVLIFFGFATVTGSYFIMTHHISVNSILMGTAIGFMSVGVLNVNNLRDSASDKESGKMTIVVKLGVRFGQIYHFVLCLSAIALIAATLVMEQRFAGMLWVLLPTVLLIMHGLRVLRATDVKTLDPELKKLSLTTLLMSVLYVAAIIW